MNQNIVEKKKDLALASRKQLLFEISAIILTVAGKFIFTVFLNLKFGYVFIVILFWALYIVYRYKRNPEILKYWGFRIDNFKKVLKKVLPFGILAIISFFIIGYFQKTINITWHIIPIAITYPIWGTIQQFLLVALVAGNLRDLKLHKVGNTAIILLTSLLFAIVHYPDNWLIFGTFILAVFYVYTYLKEKNLFILGLFHGWLGALFYYTVLNKDPFLETFGSFLN